MNIPFFSLHRQTEVLKSDLDRVSNEVFDSGNFVSGHFVKKFEKEFSEYLGITHCISCGNATDGLEIVLRAMGIGEGDEVVLPAFTWISDAEAVSLVGAKPVFVEVDESTFNISIDHLELVINTRTKAIIFTHLFGNTAGFSEVKGIARKFDIRLIEDCAQAHGASVEGDKVGTLGDAAVFSFYPTKNLGAYGDGGAMVTSDAELARKLRLLANHGQLERDQHLLEGRNSRLDELQAAYLTVKLDHLDQWNQRRTEIASRYIGGIQGDMATPDQPTNSHVFHQFVVRSKERNQLKIKLEEMGIGTAIHYPNALPFLKPYSIPSYESTFATSRLISDEILSLPIWPELTDEEIDYVIESINSFQH